MRPKPLVILLSFLVLAAARADEPRPKTECRCKHREVGDSGSKKDWALYQKGVRFHTSLDEARAMAKEEEKLVFYFHLVGDLDKEGC